MPFSIRSMAFVAVCFVMCSAPARVFADEHLPIITISPTSTFVNAIDARGTPAQPPVEGLVEINGSATIPLYKGLSFTFARVVGGLYDSTFAGITIPGVGPVQVGGYRDINLEYKLDDVLSKRFTVETGLIDRHRVCCPASNDNATASSVESHVGYLGLTYTAPPLKKLNYTTLILNATGRTAAHNPSPNALAAEVPGQDIGKKREFGASYTGTLVIPIDLKNHLTVAVTEGTGLFDYFENEPFPYYYNVTVYSLIKQINPYVGFQLGEQNLWQTKQGSPFPNPGGVIHTSEFTAQLDFHLDFNKILNKPKAPAPGSV